MELESVQEYFYCVFWNSSVDFWIKECHRGHNCDVLEITMGKTKKIGHCLNYEKITILLYCNYYYYYLIRMRLMIKNIRFFWKKSSFNWKQLIE